MEKKNKFLQLLAYSVKEKRNWALLAAVILLVTTLLTPYILGVDAEIFIVFGIAEIFIIIFINCLTDNSFFHNESKLAYYSSKPVTVKRQILISIITNIIFAAYLLLLLSMIVIFQGMDYEIFYIYKMIIPWLSVIILLVSLSSLLSGNTLMAGTMSIFNFCLPLIIYLITIFVFSILENLVIGFSSDVLTDYFLNNVYKLDYLYFVVYLERYKSVDAVYFIILLTLLAFISFLIYKLIKRRKNENTGFIVFNGYKYFVSVLACLIIPAFFSISLSRYTGVSNKIALSVLLAALSYYIIIAFIEKSFRISKMSIKVFIVSIFLFIILTGSTVAVANQYKSIVPDPRDVKMAYVGNLHRSVKSVTKFLEGKDADGNLNFEEWKRRNHIITYEEPENIKNITELHKEIIKDQTFNYEYGSRSFVIAYWMKNGKVIIRDYSLTYGNENTNDNKNHAAQNILNAMEYKKQNYPYLYDENFYKGRNLYVKFRQLSDYERVFDNVDLNEIRDCLKEDIDIYAKDRLSFLNLSMNDRYYYKDGTEDDYIIEIYEKISDIDSEYVDEIYIRNDFINTLNYIKN